jgi:hypothetical protein
MNENKFWEIISLFNWDEAGDDDAVLEPAHDQLVSLGADEIIGFEEILSEKLYQLDTRKHALACYSGDIDSMSMDDFLYSRCVVVANGRELFEEVVANPDEMPTEMEFESLLYLSEGAYEELTGEELSKVHASKFSYESCSNKAGWAGA